MVALGVRNNSKFETLFSAEEDWYHTQTNFKNVGKLHELTATCKEEELFPNLLVYAIPENSSAEEIKIDVHEEVKEKPKEPIVKKVENIPKPESRKFS